MYKLATEGVAERYAADFGVPSVGLRPACVYGPGRDRGTTAAVTEAIVAAGRGKRYRVALTIQRQNGAKSRRVVTIRVPRATPVGERALSITGTSPGPG